MSKIKVVDSDVSKDEQVLNYAREGINGEESFDPATLAHARHPKTKGLTSAQTFGWRCLLLHSLASARM